MKTVKIEKEFLETCGHASLQGLLAKQGIFGPEEVTLLFYETSTAWRAQHGGPDLYMVPEFGIPCLLESVLSLMEKGYKIHVGYFST